MPAHLTVLFPFAASDDIDEPALAELFATHPPFNFLLDRVEKATDMTWLMPNPHEPFLELTRLVWDRWPEHPPYEGAHSVLTPHLTVGYTVIDIEIGLPIASRATEVALIEEQPDESWQGRATFPLGEG